MSESRSPSLGEWKFKHQLRKILRVDGYPRLLKMTLPEIIHLPFLPSLSPDPSKNGCLVLKRDQDKDQAGEKTGEREQYNQQRETLLRERKEE